MSKLAQAIKQAAQRGEQLYLKRCTVDSVDKGERTIDCSPIDDSAQLLSVDLQALQGDSKGFVMFPKVGSEVVIGYLDRNNAVVLMMTEVDDIILDFNNKITIKNQSQSLFALLNDLLDGILKLNVTTGVGPSGTPINATTFAQIKQKLSQLME